MKKTKTLSFKLATFFVVSVIVAIAAGGITSYVVQDKIVTDYTSARLKNSVYESSKKIDEGSIRVESNLNYVELLSENYFNTKEDLKNKDLIDSTLPIIESAFSTTSKNQSLICSYWAFLNPYYTGLSVDAPEGDGLFYIRNELGLFKPHPVCNVLKYKDSDKEHITWWTQIYSCYAPLWTEPYYNANIDKNVYSYIRPIFSDTQDFLEAVGIDLYFDNLVASISHVDNYEDANVILFNDSNKIIYHDDIRTYDGKKYVGTNTTMKDITGVDNFLESENNTVTYRYNNKRRTASSVQLKNGLSYAISVSTGELRRPIRTVVFIPMLVYLGISIAILFVVYFFTKKFLDPLKQLNVGVQKVASGDLNVQLEAKNKDEIGQLTRSFSQMVEAIKSKNKIISAMAYTDGLTGVKNKNAQQEIEYRINHQIEKGTAKFAVVMLDVNNLKSINDNQGHEAGDKVIIGSCYSLCKGFSHSPVFRTGGDEFIAVVEGDDYEIRDEIYAKLRKNEIEVKNVKYDFSVGMATFDPTLDKTFKDVVKRADKEMYEMKRAKKNGKEITA